MLSFFAGKAKIILRELFSSDFCVTALKTAQKSAPFINLTVMGILNIITQTLERQITILE